MSENYTSRMEKRQQQNKPTGHKKKKAPWKKILLGLIIVFVLLMIGGGVAVGAIIKDAPELKKVNLEMPQSTRIYDEDGKQVDTLFQEENRIDVSSEEVPDEMKNAIISIEDKRFYDHPGIDWRRLVGAAISNIKNGWGSEGGSTLTQQVIKRTVLTPEKTLTRKIQEAWLALKLERKYSKDEILELYMNNVYFGHGAYGIKTAAVTYFGEEDLTKLNHSQAALLAGLPNSPSATNPYEHPERAKKRRNLVLVSMEDNGFITKEEGAEAKDLSIADIILEKEKKVENDDPHNAYIDAVYDQLVKEEKIVTDEEFFQEGLEIYTHLDTDAQEAAYELLHSEDMNYPDENFEAGISLVDTESGEIKAIGGGRNFKAISYSNYGSHIKHQPGSTIKPFVDYGPAIEYLQWPTSYELSDEPYQYSDGTEINEWDGEYWGDVSMRRALEWSRNIPALKTFQAVGADKAQDFAGGLGVDIDPIYESAAIGGFEGVSPLQMASGYAAFGNGGTFNEPSAVKKVVFPNGDEWEPELESEKAMKDYTAYMITDMLKTVLATGTGMQANVPGIPVAGKTGSTNLPEEDRIEHGIDDGLRDSWFAGYTTDYSLAVWTGYPSFKDEDGEVQYINYDGSQDIAKQLFQKLMTKISSPDTKDFVKPDSVVTSGSELYVSGTKPKKPEKKEPVEEPKEEPKEEVKEEPEPEPKEEKEEEVEEEPEEEPEEEEVEEEPEEEEVEEEPEEEPEEEEVEEEPEEEEVEEEPEEEPEEEEKEPEKKPDKNEKPDDKNQDKEKENDKDKHSSEHNEDPNKNKATNEDKDKKQDKKISEDKEDEKEKE